MSDSASPRVRAPRSVRRLLQVTSAVLAVLLLVLLGVLLWLLWESRTPAYDSRGGIRPLHVIIGPGRGAKPFFDAPMGAAFGKNGRVYVADTGNNRIVVFDRNANYLFEFGTLGIGKPAVGGVSSWEPGRFNYPTDVAVDEGGDVYVADFRNDQIQVFDADGKFLRVFPDRMSQVGKGASGQDGTGLAVTAVSVREGRVYATDQYQIVVFDTNGKLWSQFGYPGSGSGGMDHPNGIAIGTNSMLFVSDSNNGRVLGMDPSGRILWTVGRRLGDFQSDQASEFEVPRGITCMDDGNALVADALASQLVRLTMSSAIDARFGQRGDAPGELNFPTDVDASGDRVVVADKGNDRVQVVTLEGD